eukprot:TRINITY_DN483_c0_g1_i2.p1 TRINITY_DN483_c0_g1~~TRINITY_DN483_c0_g1_i2.p1  ORF type:complete len:1016 (+),score=228.18 TRINITY_DN483_c0_g1_i2:88-3135(+)
MGARRGGARRPSRPCWAPPHEERLARRLPLCTAAAAVAAVPCCAASRGRNSESEVLWATQHPTASPEPPGWTAAPTQLGQPQVLWQFGVGGTRVEAPALWKEFVYIASSNRPADSSHIDAVCGEGQCGSGHDQLSGGDLWWHYGTGAAPRGDYGVAAPVVWPSAQAERATVYVISGHPEQLFVLDANHSDKEDIWPLWMWRPPAGAERLMPPAVGPDGVAFVSGFWDGSARLCAVAGDDFNGTSRLLWHLAVGDSVAAPVVAEGKVIVAAHNASGAFLLALRADRGANSSGAELLWTSPVVEANTPAVWRGTGHPRYLPSLGFVVYVTVSDASRSGGPRARAMAVDAATGKRQWTADLGQLPPGTTVSDAGAGFGMVFFTMNSSGGEVMAFDDTGGQLVWTQPLDGGNVSCTAPVFSGDDLGLLFVVCATQTEQWVWVAAAYTGIELWRIRLDSPGRRRSSQGEPGPVGDSCVTSKGFPCGGCLDDQGEWGCPPAPPSPGPGGLLYIPGTMGEVYCLAFLPTQSPTAAPTAPGPHGESSLQRYLAPCVIVGSVLLVLAALVVPLLRRRRGYKPPSGGFVDPATRRYQLVRKLGSGAFGVVYLVRRKDDGAEFAIKYIACESEEDRLEAAREWHTITSLQQGHPNMIEVHELFMDRKGGIDQLQAAGSSEHIQGCSPSMPTGDGSLLSNIHRLEATAFVGIVMRYHQEGDLKQYILSLPKDEPVPEGVILSYAGQIASLLQMLHARKPPLIHRDLKPENVLLSDSGKTVVVTDFGLARSASSLYCKTHAGTLAFIAPELWDRHYSIEVDLWALGCILYAMVTKFVAKEETRCLWREAAVPGFQAKIAQEVAERGYSARVVELVTALLSPSPRQRPTAARVVAWLEEAATAPPDPAAAAAEPATLPRSAELEAAQRTPPARLWTVGSIASGETLPCSPPPQAGLPGGAQPAAEPPPSGTRPAPAAGLPIHSPPPGSPSPTRTGSLVVSGPRHLAARPPPAPRRPQPPASTDPNDFMS